MLKIQKKNEEIIQKKIDDYYEKQKQIKEKQEELELELIKRNKEELLRKKENEIIFNEHIERKERYINEKNQKTLNDIKRKEDHNKKIKKRN